MNRTLLLLFGIIFLAACGESKSAQKEIKPKKKVTRTGEEVYQTYCVVCHGADGKLMVNGAKDLSKTIISHNEKVELITNGKGMMAPHRSLLSKEEINNVANYINKFVKH